MFFLKVLMFFCFLLIGCDYIKNATGVSNDSAYNFKSHKQYLVSLPLIGEVIEKNICINCKYNKYRIKVKLNNFISDSINIGFRSYEPFYSIEENKISLSVNEEIYFAVKLNAECIKKSNSKYLIANEQSFKILSDDEKKWFD